jgi:hypothetical protein
MRIRLQDGQTRPASIGVPEQRIAPCTMLWIHRPPVITRDRVALRAPIQLHEVSDASRPPRGGPPPFPFVDQICADSGHCCSVMVGNWKGGFLFNSVTSHIEWGVRAHVPHASPISAELASAQAPEIVLQRKAATFTRRSIVGTPITTDATVFAARSPITSPRPKMDGPWKRENMTKSSNVPAAADAAMPLT